MPTKVADDVLAVVDQIPNGASVAIGGFGLTGAPIMLCDALCELGKRGIHVISNNAGIDPTGVGRLAEEGRIRKFTGSFPSNEAFFAMYNAGDVELELVPQGTLAERLRAGGAGIPAFYTPTSAGTILADGTYPSRLAPDGTPVSFMDAKETRVFDGIECVLEFGIKPDFALVKAQAADRLGNLRFRLGSGNFNAPCAMAGGVTIVEAVELRGVGSLAPDDIDLPGVFVNAVVKSTGGWVGIPDHPDQREAV